MKSNQYGNSAPDGFYKMFVASADLRNGKLCLPLCEHAPGALHGDWSVSTGVKFPVTGDYVLGLLNDTIISATLLREWDLNHGAWKP